MAETSRRREKQLAYNEKHNITPVGVTKSVQDIMEGARRMPTRSKSKAKEAGEPKVAYGAELENLTPSALARKIKQLESQMHEHAMNLEFEEAAALRDQLAELKQAAFLG